MFLHFRVYGPSPTGDLSPEYQDEPDDSSDDHLLLPSDEDGDDEEDEEEVAHEVSLLRVQDFIEAARDDDDAPNLPKHHR